MGEVLSQNEIDSLLKALSIKNRSKIMILPVLQSFQRNICERWRLSLNITEDSCQPIFLFIYGKMFRLR